MNWPRVVRAIVQLLIFAGQWLSRRPPPPKDKTP